MKKPMQTIGLVACLGAFVVAGFLTTGCGPSRYSRSTGEYVDDKSISTKVKTELLSDSSVPGMDVSVQTFRGTVQLTGFVDTLQQKQRAAELARNVAGVQWVRNDIIVKTAMEPAGAAPPQKQDNQQQD